MQEMYGRFGEARVGGDAIVDLRCRQLGYYAIFRSAPWFARVPPDVALRIEVAPHYGEPVDGATQFATRWYEQAVRGPLMPRTSHACRHSLITDNEWGPSAERPILVAVSPQ